MSSLSSANLPDANGPSSLPSFRYQLKAFLVEWIKLNLGDTISLLLLVGLSYGIYRSPVLLTRTFPITFDDSGDIVYPIWAYPERDWIVAPWLAAVLSIYGPVLVYIVAQIRIRSIWDASNAIMGSARAIALANFFQVVCKQLIGGFRPYFLDVCKPDMSRAVTHNKTGLNGVGFQAIMYTTEICTQSDPQKLQNAITSFPSGHSAVTFAAFTFLFLWSNAKLKVWADHQTAVWRLFFTMLPLLCALIVACSLTVDASHNWYDIVGGSSIGMVMAVASYRSMYAAVFDWRFNHVPLQEQRPLNYSVEEASGIIGQTLTRRAGWDFGKYKQKEFDGTSGFACFFQRHEPVSRRTFTADERAEDHKKTYAIAEGSV